MADLTLRGVVKRYGAVEAVRPLDLDIAHNEFVVLVGPSGCGKSTTLRMIAGLEEVTEGEIRIGDRVVNHLPPRERNISMVFQNYALYPHMNVAQNQGFGLRMAGRPRAEIREKVGRAAGMLGLDRLMERRPAELSGGQRQRVAMGRAIVREPAVFLFDEPLSNLDAKLRGQMRTEIKKLHAKVESTIVYVTHDQVEAMTLADRIVVMRDGVVEQVGTPDQVYRTPATRFVAGFLGSPPMNLLPGRIVSRADGDGLGVALGNDVVLPLAEHRFATLREGRAVTLGLRPDALAPAGSAPHMGRPFRLTADLELVEPLGGEVLLVVTLGGDEAIARVFRPRMSFAPGRGLPFEIDLDEIHLFDDETGARLNLDRPDG